MIKNLTIFNVISGWPDNFDGNVLMTTAELGPLIGDLIVALGDVKGKSV